MYPSLCLSPQLQLKAWLHSLNPLLTSYPHSLSKVLAFTLQSRDIVLSGKATGPPLADPSGRRGGPEVPSYLVVVLHQHRMPPPITHTSRDLRCHRCCGLPCTARRRTREKQVRVPLIGLPGCREGMLLRETVCVPFSWHSHHWKPSPNPPPTSRAST